VTVHLLTTAVQRYPWGSTSAIPELTGVEPDGRPVAELWVGAHPQAPSTLTDSGRRLDEVVAADPVGELGQATAARYAGFPFLLKVLAAARPLSLQVHPSADQAAAGFAREEAAGTARDSPSRAYRDDQPKPEVVCAVTEFALLSGFRPVEDSAPVLRALDRGDGSPGGLLLADVVRSLLDPPGDGAGAPAEAGRLAATVRTLLTLVPPDGESLVAAAVRAASGARADPATRPGVLADLDLLDLLAAEHPADPGVVVALLLHHLRLFPGQALFTPAGALHAYLSGTAVELMASSDNVLRGGLTGKHVDVTELMSLLDTTPGPPRVVQPVRVSAAEWDYPTPAEQFHLSRVELAPGEGTDLAPVEGPQLLLCTAGAVDVAPVAPAVAPDLDIDTAVDLDIDTPVDPDPDTGADVGAAADGARQNLSRGSAAYLSDATGRVGVRATGPGPATVFRARLGLA